MGYARWAPAFLPTLCRAPPILHVDTRTPGCPDARMPPIRPPSYNTRPRYCLIHGKMPGFAQKSSGIIMEAERQNQLAARLADYAEREQALRRYL